MGSPRFLFGICSEGDGPLCCEQDPQAPKSLVRSSKHGQSTPSHLAGKPLGRRAGFHTLLASAPNFQGFPFYFEGRNVPREMHINEDFALLEGKLFKMQIRNLLGKI